jgi:hypothetical protein
MTKLDTAWKNCLKQWDGVIKILDWLENLEMIVSSVNMPTKGVDSLITQKI